MSKRRRFPASQQPVVVDELEQCVERARRQRRRGDDRKALVLLREACFKAGSDARLWTLYAAQSWRMGRSAEARQALTQALWLRERAHDTARANVLRSLIASVELGNGLTSRAA
jgi:Flp pilus assembly protein TadD